MFGPAGFRTCAGQRSAFSTMVGDAEARRAGTLGTCLHPRSAHGEHDVRASSWRTWPFQVCVGLRQGCSAFIRALLHVACRLPAGLGKEVGVRGEGSDAAVNGTNATGVGRRSLLGRPERDALRRGRSTIQRHRGRWEECFRESLSYCTREHGSRRTPPATRTIGARRGWHMRLALWRNSSDGNDAFRRMEVGPTKAWSAYHLRKRHWRAKVHAAEKLPMVHVSMFQVISWCAGARLEPVRLEISPSATSADERCSCRRNRAKTAQITTGAPHGAATQC